MYAYFHKTPLDQQYYQKHISHRLPWQIVDAHCHFNLPEHVKNVTQESILNDWALESGLLMSYDDSLLYSRALFPDRAVECVMLPWPLRDADTKANNRYISSLITNEHPRGLYTVRPEYAVETIEQEFQDGRFCGFKPYPYMASAVKGAEISIFDFMPRQHLALANRLKAPVLLHLPRAGRLPDPDNVTEIRTILMDYPDVKLVIAHFGRCFHHEFFQKALAEFGSDIHSLWFDTAAVLNPRVYQLAFDHLDYHKILFGTDAPIMLWHGKREWKNGSYYNLCREDFGWNLHPYPEQEAEYTFFIYEQLNSLLNAIGGSESVLEAVFGRNAQAVYQPFGGC
jgi:predicted TIM-barrel fold metal-dependent hydrolase